MQFVDLKTQQEKMNDTRFCHRERSKAIYSHGIRLPQLYSLLRNDMVVAHLIEDFVKWYKEYNTE